MPGKRHMIQREVLACSFFWILTAILCAHAGQKPIKAVTLEEARRLLQEPSSMDSLGTIPLREFESYREIDIGGNRRVLAISCSDSGGLVAFGSDGKAIASIQTG
jgi:hypothetical protein